MGLSELELWAASGAMWLTGPPEGPPRVAPGSPAQLVARSLDRVRRAAESRTGVKPALPGVEILGERAALLGLRPRWPWSCGGSFRFVPTQDGFLGISLSRATDLDLVRALVADASVTANEIWAAVAAWARRQRTAEAAERCGLLGLGFARFPQEPAAQLRGPVAIRHGVARTRSRGRKPLVVDLTALWAGPLCANLLGLTGVDVTRVESKQRTCGAPRASAFNDLLRRGHNPVVLDFGSAVDLEFLHELVFNADLVLEASRARALMQLGLDAERAVANGTSWLSITARGRTSNTIGFGDDVAADGGLVLWSAGEPAVCGDALGDPLSGVVAAAAASEALISDRAQLIDVSMVDVCRAAAQGPTEPHQVIDAQGRWWVQTHTARFPVLEPRVRCRGTN